MNVYQQPETVAEKEREIKILQYNGIYEDSARRKSKSKYRFYIYHYEIVALFQAIHYGSAGHPWLSQKTRKKELWKYMDVNNLSKEIMKAKKVAIQSLYTLGYDLGMVEVCVYPTAPKYTVSKVFFHQEMAQQLETSLQKVSKSLQETEESVEQKETILGADVELVLRHTSGKFVVASKYFSKKGRVGYDAIWLKGKRNRFPLVELRPAPSKNPKKLFNNLHVCLSQGVKQINDLEIQWLAGGKPLKSYPIGGHIHFSQTLLSPQFIRVLDNYLTLPLSLLESKESLSRRPKYGCLGDYREQFHGGFEYRTPPCWMVHPIIAKGVLCLAKVISIEYKQLRWLPLLSYDTQKDFYEGDRHKLYPVVQAVWAGLKGTLSYSKYQKELNQFFGLIENGYVWDEFADVRHTWKMPPYQ